MHRSLKKILEKQRKNIHGIIPLLGQADKLSFKICKGVHIIKTIIPYTSPLRLIQQESVTDWKELYQGI